ncbi:MAG: hypothetical protein L0Z62_04010 [Gemmataceae bacterium]|nr:hypothetical protein [Gemmataceae bacterium]
MFSEQLTQALGIPTNPTHPAAQTASFNTGGVDMSKFERCLAIIDIGAVSGSSPTFNAKWQESADDSSYSDVAGYSNLSITQITSASKTVTMEIRASQLSAGKRYVRVAVTIGGSSPSFTCAVILLGGEAHQKPASANDAAQVVERKVVS